LQAGLVVALFLGALGSLLFNSFVTLGLPRRELEARNQLREASGSLAGAAAESNLPPEQSEELDHRLHEITQQSLKDFPGVEGGFYLSNGVDRFSGYAYPTGPPGPQPLPRNEPPPLEAPYIRVQARESSSLGRGESQVQVRDVGPSRVAVVTQPAGVERPAKLVAWTMIRLTGPEQLEGRVRRFYVSVGLALGGMALSMILMVNLGRTLSRQRREQERLRDELRRSERLAALGTLLAGVAHEVRNPLAGIRSTVQLWERLPETARSPDSMAAVIQAVDRLNEIVSRLLYFARADTSERQPVSVNDAITDTLNLLDAQAAGQGVVVQRDLAPDLPRVSGSAGALRQVFLNLATNALQAMPQGGTMRCSTRVSNHKVEVTVADSGPGIPSEDRQHLFEPFFTTRHEGTGLGLALCREIVTQHEGQIEVESSEGQGVAVRIWLPVLD
jgi:signal transduction histidine kinase